MFRVPATITAIAAVLQVLGPPAAHAQPPLEILPGGSINVVF
jgi:hypothetical protein